MSLQQALKAVLAVGARASKTQVLQNFVRIAPSEVRAQDARVVAVSDFEMECPDFEPFLLGLEFANELAKILEPVDIIIFDETRRQASFGFPSGREVTYVAELDEEALLRYDRLFEQGPAPVDDGEVLMSPETLSRFKRGVLSRGRHEANLPMRMTFRASPFPAVVRFSDHFKALVMPVAQQSQAA